MILKFVKPVLLVFICVAISSYSFATTLTTTQASKKHNMLTHKKSVKKLSTHKKTKKTKVSQKPAKKLTIAKINSPVKNRVSAVVASSALASDIVTESLSSTKVNASGNAKTVVKKSALILQKNVTVEKAPPVAVKTGIKPPKLYSYSALAIDVKTGEIFVSKNPDDPLPIASITKLMTAMVVLDSGVDLDGYVAISSADIDDLRNTYSRLRVGVQFRRRDLMLLALMSSENRAAAALARTTFAGGTSQFIRKMNEKALALGMEDTRFYDPTGLVTDNRSTSLDLAKMVKAAYSYDAIRQDTTTKAADVSLGRNYIHRYINSDSLVRGDNIDIELSKTGFINEAGHCLALYTTINGRSVVMVFLNSAGKSGRVIDAISVSKYIGKLYRSYR